MESGTPCIVYSGESLTTVRSLSKHFEGLPLSLKGRWSKKSRAMYVYWQVVYVDQRVIFRHVPRKWTHASWSHTWFIYNLNRVEVINNIHIRQLLLCIYTTGIIQTLQAFIMYTNTGYNMHGTFPLLFNSPCWFPFAPLSNPSPLTWKPS
jgi:hypothetical protein